MPSGGTGTVLAGRYRIMRQLGAGGMGSVWLAEDTQLDNKPFAIKMLPSILVSNKRAYRQLKDEALVAMKLTHPNIVTLRAFEENGGNPFLVMDYIDGQTLDDYLAEEGKLSEGETVKLLKPIAAALDYAHGEGILHRDVNSKSILIRKDGHPFIRDFGVVRQMQETLTRVTGTSSLGTILYMSPEQLKGDAPTASQDIYSLAAVAYECLAGEPPFSHGQIDHQILNNAPPALPESIKIAPNVLAGLAKDPKGRLSACGMMFAADGAARRDDAANSRPPPLRKTGAPEIRKAGELKTIMLPGGVEMELRWCPPGTFLMGSPLSEKGRDVDETLHRVVISKGFWMGATAVTQKQWRIVMGGNPAASKDHFSAIFSLFGGSSDLKENCPVENVSWEDCQMFLRRVNSAQTAFALHLPTEAQWEYACRAGTATAYFWGNALNGDKANCDGRSPCGTAVRGRYLEQTQPVRSYAPNGWGLFEMHGNVHEWCSDWYGSYGGDATDPVGPEAGEFRVFRGGSWYDRARYCRSAYRDGNTPNLRSGCLGFRVICSE